MKMRVIICCCLLAFVLSCKVTAAINHTVVEEKSQVFLPCPHPVEGKVTWSRESNGNRVDILTVDGDRDIRHNDPGKRYGSFADKSLLISRVNLLDSGRYLCNNESAVELKVVPGQTARLTAVERTNISLTCRSAGSGSSVPTWIRENRGSYVTVSRQNEMDKHDRYSPKGNTLMITDVQPDDAGLYYCDGKPVAYLNVTKEQSEILQVYPQICLAPLVVCVIVIVIVLLLAGFLLLLCKWMKTRNLRSSNGRNVELSVARHNRTPVSTGEDSTYQSLDPASRDQDQIYSSLT